MSKVKCVIFDCDGTLVDSERLCCQALANVFAEFGHVFPSEHYMAYFQGGKLADILSSTQEQLGLNISLDVLEPLYRKQTEILFKENLKPIPGVQKLLTFLNKQNIEYCVASNAPQEKIRMSLQLTHLLPQFEGKIYSAFDANSWKPEPDLIHLTMMNMGFASNECLYIDDTLKGLEAGVRAGVESYFLKAEDIGSDKNTPNSNVIHQLTDVIKIIEHSNV